jgi:hypothetical protein
MFEIKLNKDELGNAFCVRVLRESQQIFFLFVPSVRLWIIDMGEWGGL